MKKLWLNCQTNYADRASYVQLWMSGMSARAIARRSKTSVTTVCRWIKRWRLEGNLTKKNCIRRDVSFNLLSPCDYQTARKSAEPLHPFRHIQRPITQPNSTEEIKYSPLCTGNLVHCDWQPKTLPGMSELNMFLHWLNISYFLSLGGVLSSVANLRVIQSHVPYVLGIYSMLEIIVIITTREIDVY